MVGWLLLDLCQPWVRARVDVQRVHAKHAAVVHGREHDCLIQCLRGRDMRCPGRGRDEPTWQHPTDPLASRIHGWGEKEAMRVLGRTGRFPPKSTCRGHQRMKWSSYNCTIPQEEKQVNLLPADSQTDAASPSIKHEIVEQSWKKTFLHS